MRRFSISMRLIVPASLPRCFWLVPAAVLLLASVPGGAFGQLQINELGNAAVKVSPLDDTALRVKQSTDGEDARGVYGISEGGTNSYGVYGLSGGSYSYGVYGHSKDSYQAYGVYGKTSGNNYSEYAGYFEGDLAYTGTLSNPSDQKLKKNAEGLGKGLSGEVAEQVQANAQGTSAGGEARDSPRSEARAKVLQLDPKSYRYRRGEYAMGLPEGKQYGLVAQQVEELFPELVHTQAHPADSAQAAGNQGAGEEGGLKYKSVSYLQLVPLLVQTVKEQQAEIDALRERVRALEENQ